MRFDRITAIVLTALLSFSVAGFAADDQLFDTQAAAKHIEQGIAHLKAKNFDAAIGDFEQAVSIEPDAESYYYLGYAYYLKGKKKDGENRAKSLENFHKAFELDPGFSPVRLKPAEQEETPEQASAPSTTMTQPEQREMPEQVSGPSTTMTQPEQREMPEQMSGPSTTMTQPEQREMPEQMSGPSTTRPEQEEPPHSGEQSDPPAL
jgi:tetratricopeptide (TPR) repeat protein